MNIKKYFVGGVLGIFVIIGIIFWYNSRIDAAEKRGAAAQQAQHDIALGKATERTLQLEEDLRLKNLELDVALQAKQEQVIVTRDRVRTVVETIIQDNSVYQQCEVDQAVIDELNQLRSLTRE